jgi:hypothetical protein
MAPACAFIALLSLWSAVDFYAATEPLAEPGADTYRISDQQVRFAEAAASLSPSGEIGYVTDQKQNVEWAMFLGAQYVLAPRVLVPLDRHPQSQWVLGNFARAIDMAAYAGRHDLVLVRDFGQGVVLFRGGAK